MNEEAFDVGTICVYGIMADSVVFVACINNQHLLTTKALLCRLQISSWYINLHSIIYIDMQTTMKIVSPWNPVTLNKSSKR